MAATTVVPTKFTAKDDFSKVVKRMTKEIKSFGRQGVHAMNRFDAKVTRTFGKIRKTLGSAGTLFGGIALFSILSSGIGVIANFEQANANLASILGVEIELTKELQENSKRLGATTSFTASEVAGLQTEYAKLGFTEKEILKVTKSTLSLAAATKTELPQAAKQVGSTLRAFSLEASQASMVADVFAKSTSKSALNMEFLDTAMSTVAPVANKFGFTVKDVTALLGNLADSGFDASSAATATRNILLNLADSNGKLARSLGKPVKDLPSLIKGLDKLKNSGIDLAGALNLTDKRSVAAFATFLDGTKNIEKLSKELGIAGGTAESMANKQLDTLTGRVTILNSAYEGFLLSLDDGTGAFSEQAKTIVEVATDMLSLLSNTAKSTEALTEQEKVIRGYAETGLRFVSVLKAVVQGYIAFKVITTIIRAVAIAQAAYNAVMVWYSAVAVTAALTGASFAAVIWATLWPILAVIAAVALIVIAFKNWGKITAWVGEKWNQVVEWFKAFDFVAMFKKIGKVIIDFLLFPLKSVLFVLSKIPGTIGDLASSGLDTINDITGKLTVNDGTSPKSPISTPENQSAESIQKSITQNFLSIDIKDNGGNVESTEMTGGNDIPIMLQSTLAF